MERVCSGGSAVCLMDAGMRGEGALGQLLSLVGQDVSLVKAGVKARGLEAGDPVASERCVRWMQVRGGGRQERGRKGGVGRAE